MLDFSRSTQGTGTCFSTCQGTMYRIQRPLCYLQGCSLQQCLCCFTARGLRCRDREEESLLQYRATARANPSHCSQPAKKPYMSDSFSKVAWNKRCAPYNVGYYNSVSHTGKEGPPKTQTKVKARIKARRLWSSPSVVSSQSAQALPRSKLSGHRAFDPCTAVNLINSGEQAILL